MRSAIKRKTKPCVSQRFVDFDLPLICFEFIEYEEDEGLSGGWQFRRSTLLLQSCNKTKTKLSYWQNCIYCYLALLKHLFINITPLITNENIFLFRFHFKVYLYLQSHTLQHIIKIWFYLYAYLIITLHSSAWQLLSFIQCTFTNFCLRSINRW